jgi:hypothetical protein
MSNEFKFNFKVGRSPVPMRAKVGESKNAPASLRGKVVEFDVSDLSDWTEMPGCISLVRNTPPADAPLLPVPDGLSRCPVCNEYKGVMAFREVPNLVESNPDVNPETPMRVQCICDGVLCPGCEKNWYHRPGTNVWEARVGVLHFPSGVRRFPAMNATWSEKRGLLLIEE